MNCRPVFMLSVLGICARILQINILFIQMCLGCAGDEGNQVGKGVVRGGGQCPLHWQCLYLRVTLVSIQLTDNKQVIHQDSHTPHPNPSLDCLSRVRVSLSIFGIPDPSPQAGNTGPALALWRHSLRHLIRASLGRSNSRTGSEKWDLSRRRYQRYPEDDIYFSKILQDCCWTA